MTIAKSNGSASVLAYFAVAKYVDTLPIYRQEAILKRIGTALFLQTMASIRLIITILKSHSSVHDRKNELDFLGETKGCHSK